MSWQRKVNLKAIALRRAKQARASTNYKSQELQAKSSFSLTITVCYDFSVGFETVLRYQSRPYKGRKVNIHKKEKGPMDLHTHDHLCSKALIPTQLCNTIDLAASKPSDFFHQLTQSITILTMVLFASSSCSIINISVNNENVYLILNN